MFKIRKIDVNNVFTDDNKKRKLTKGRSVLLSIR